MKYNKCNGALMYCDQCKESYPNCCEMCGDAPLTREEQFAADWLATSPKGKPTYADAIKWADDHPKYGMVSLDSVVEKLRRWGFKNAAVLIYDHFTIVEKGDQNEL